MAALVSGKNLSVRSFAPIPLMSPLQFSQHRRRHRSGNCNCFHSDKQCIFSRLLLWDRVPRRFREHIDQPKKTTETEVEAVSQEPPQALGSLDIPRQETHRQSRTAISQGPPQAQGGLKWDKCTAEEAITTGSLKDILSSVDIPRQESRWQSRTTMAISMFLVVFAIFTFAILRGFFAIDQNLETEILAPYNAAPIATGASDYELLAGGTIEERARYELLADMEKAQEIELEFLADLQRELAELESTSMMERKASMLRQLVQ